MVALLSSTVSKLAPVLQVDETFGDDAMQAFSGKGSSTSDCPYSSGCWSDCLVFNRRSGIGEALSWSEV